jgi:hypothetical protein
LSRIIKFFVARLLMPVIFELGIVGLGAVIPNPEIALAPSQMNSIR